MKTLHDMSIHELEVEEYFVHQYLKRIKKLLRKRKIGFLPSMISKTWPCEPRMFGGQDSMMGWIRCEDCGKVKNRAEEPRCHCGAKRPTKPKRKKK